MASVATIVDESAARRTTRGVVGSGQSILRILAYNRAGFVASWVLAAIVVISFVAPLVIPEPLPDMTQVYQEPSLQHLLGTDFQGADVLEQVLRGGQTVLIVGAVAAAIVTLIAVTFGSLAAYAGGSVDSALSADVSLLLFASAAGFLQSGATYTATAVFTNGSRYIGCCGTFTLPM